jgi:Uma2 family endonuclease
MKVGRAGREPDVLFVATEHLDRIKQTYLDGPADLVVEVISPESRGRDRGEKFFEYQEARIPEYWLLDPETERAEFYQLDERGAYHTIEPGADDVYRAVALPGFWLRPSWLWQQPLPAVDDTLLQIAGDDYARYLIERLRTRGFLGE